MKRLPLPKPSWLTQLGLAVTSVLVIVAGFAVASVLFTALLIVGLIAGGWLWWQYRKLIRKVSRASQASSDFIEGDYVIEPTPPALTDKRTIFDLPPEDSASRAPRRERRSPR